MQTFKKNSYCSFCGTQFSADKTYPKHCDSCQNVTYINPVPVAVVIIQAGNKVLLIRRNIEPKKGKLALPGGFLEVNESWQEGAAREVREEIGLEILSTEISLFDAQSAPDGTVLIFGFWKSNIKKEEMDFLDSSEVSEIQWVSANDAVEYAFPLHEGVMQRFWEMR